MADVPKIVEEKVGEEESNELDKVDPIRQVCVFIGGSDSISVYSLSLSLSWYPCTI